MTDIPDNPGRSAAPHLPRTDAPHRDLADVPATEVISWYSRSERVAFMDGSASATSYSGTCFRRSRTGRISVTCSRFSPLAKLAPACFQTRHAHRASALLLHQAHIPQPCSNP